MKNYRKRIALQFIASGLALIVDRIFGEPPGLIHPVAGFGKMMAKAEPFLWRDTVTAGVTFSALGLGVGAIIASLVESPFLGTLLATYVAVAEKSLLGTAKQVQSAIESGNIIQAREILPSLVGRDSSQLDELEMVRAVVESIAENTSDAVVAPMFYASIFGGAGAIIYRIVNTMDAMVGYRNNQYLNFGKSSARIDDIANWIPARLASVCLLSIPRRGQVSISSVLADSSNHPSPNAGVIESAFAHKLGIKLGGINSYGGRTEHRPTMGKGSLPERKDISLAIALSRDSNSMLACFFVVAGALLFVKDKYDS